MPIYRVLVEDFRFIFNELLELEKRRDLFQYGELLPDLIDDILTNVGRFCEDVLDSLYQSANEEGCRFASESGMGHLPGLRIWIANNQAGVVLSEAKPASPEYYKWTELWPGESLVRIKAPFG